RRGPARRAFGRQRLDRPERTSSSVPVGVRTVQPDTCFATWPRATCLSLQRAVMTCLASGLLCILPACPMDHAKEPDAICRRPEMATLLLRLSTLFARGFDEAEASKALASMDGLAVRKLRIFAYKDLTFRGSPKPFFSFDLRNEASGLVALTIRTLED